MMVGVFTDELKGFVLPLTSSEMERVTASQAVSGVVSSIQPQQSRGGEDAGRGRGRENEISPQSCVIGWTGHSAESWAALLS